MGTHEGGSWTLGGGRRSTTTVGEETVAAVRGAFEAAVAETCGTAATETLDEFLVSGATATRAGVGDLVGAATAGLPVAPATLGRAFGRALADRVADDADGPALVERVATRLGAALSPAPSPFAPPPVETARLDADSVLVRDAAGKLPCPLLSGVLEGAARAAGSVDVTEVRCCGADADRCEHLVRPADD